MRNLKVLLPIIFCAVSALGIQPGHGGQSTPSDGVGTVDFVTTCAPAVRQDFNRAVALLHSFEYDAARDLFRAIEARDPDCAMAHWGAAMTYFHGAWDEIDEKNGAREAVLARRSAESSAGITAREKRYIAAVSAIYSDPAATILERARAFSAEMAKAHEADPNDDETSIFFALSLFVSAGRDKTYANQQRCGAILEPLFKKLPNHPGIAHYLIHCYDNPALAEKGLPAARAYAKIAPDSAHATHMPSHIFVRLGLWQETVQSNLRSMEVAAREPSLCYGQEAQLHAMHFLQFAYLQLGLKTEARKVAEKALALPTENNCESGEYVAASYALQAHDWEMAAKLNPEFKSDDISDSEVIWTGIGVAAARTGDVKRAQRAEGELAQLRDLAAKTIAAGRDSPYEVARLEVEAWTDQAQGVSAKAIDCMKSADEAGGYAAWVQPTPSEQLGDLLMEQHHPAAALAAYRKVLTNTPNLFNALYGAARAAGETGDRDTSRSYYSKLIDVAGAGDRSEIEAARTHLAQE